MGLLHDEIYHLLDLSVASVLVSHFWYNGGKGGFGNGEISIEASELRQYKISVGDLILLTHTLLLTSDTMINVVKQYRSLRPKAYSSLKLKNI